MMNELADRLESWVEAHRENEGTNAEGEVLSECGEFAVCNSEAIIKALRFAADMETLVQAGCEPGLETQVDNPDNPDDPERCVVRWWNVRHWQFSYGVDYYTAARRAVEELEKGESDGK